MRIIYPGQTYKEALQLASCPRLDAWREDLCVKTVMSIYKGGHLAQYVTQTKACAHNYPIRTSNNWTLYSVEQSILRIALFRIQYPRLTRNRQIMLIETHF